jgi:hypothetical protein
VILACLVVSDASGGSSPLRRALVVLGLHNCGRRVAAVLASFSALVLAAALSAPSTTFSCPATLSTTAEEPEN